MKKTIIIMLCLSILFGCSSSKIEETAEPSDTSDNKENLIHNLVDMKDIFIEDSDLKQANSQYNKFAYKLFDEINTKDNNTLLSPYSLYSVLSILANGANNSEKGNTKLILENTLGLTVNDLNKFYEATSKDITSYNSLLFNSNLGLSIDEETRNTISKYYGDVIKEEDFNKNIVDEVNNWCKEKTDGLIDSIIDEDDIDVDTALLLLNATNVQGNFDVRFNPNNTVVQEFKNSDDSTANVEMMKQTLDGYWHSDLADGFVKSLDSDYYFVGVLLNEDADLGSNPIIDIINSYIEYEGLDEENNSADIKHYTNLSFPKFEIDTTNDLDDTLKQLGLESLYDYNKCDFSLFGSNLIYLHNVREKNHIKVDEEKVEMSSVTIANGKDGTSMPPDTKEEIYHDLVFDRPFIYALVKQKYIEETDSLENIILFIGSVNNLEGTNGN